METDPIPVRSIGNVKEEQQRLDSLTLRANNFQQRIDTYSYSFQNNDALSNQEQIENLQEYQLEVDKLRSGIVQEQSALNATIARADTQINQAAGTSYPDATVPTEFMSETDRINQFLGSSYPDSFIPTGPTDPGTPSITSTRPELISPVREDVIQSESALFSLDNAMFGGALTSVGEEAKQAVYASSVAALGPIGSTLAGAATAIVDTANAVTNTLTSTINSVVGAITDVLSGKILTDAVSGLMSTAEKFVAMVGEAAYQNVMGFLEAFKSVETILNSAANIASDIGQFVKKTGADIKAVLSKDWDKLSWPDINWARIKSCFDTETFSKIGEGISNFVGNTKLPIGLSLNQISDLTKNLDVKEQLLKQVEDVKSGVTKLGTQALETLYGQMAAVNNAILAITNLPNSLTSMFNGLVNRLDPLKERAANKVIMDYIKKGKVVKDDTTTSSKSNSSEISDAGELLSQRRFQPPPKPTGEPTLGTNQSSDHPSPVPVDSSPKLGDPTLT